MDHTADVAQKRATVITALHSVGPTLFVATLIAVRYPSTLFRAEFWAEDATEFLFDALSIGFRSLTTPVYGYHFFLERIIAYGATFLSAFYLPYVYAWSSLAINSVALAFVVRDGFSWIAPQRWIRMLLAVLFAVGPGTADVLLNLSNLPSTLALLGLLLLIERPFQLSAKRVVALTVLAASSGQMILWLPVVAYLAWLTRAKAYWAVALAIVLFAVLNLAGNHQAASAARLLDYGRLAYIPRILAENAFTRLAPGPFFGSNWTGLLMLSPPAVFWSAAVLGVGAFAAIARGAFRADRHGTTILFLGYAGAVGIFGVVAFSRTYALPQLIREAGSLHWELRYAFLPGALAMLLLTSCLLRPLTSAALQKAGRIAYALIVVQVAATWPLGFPRPDLHWPERSERVQAILDHSRRMGQPTVLTIDDLAIHPVGWVPANGRFGVVVPGG